MPKVKEVAVFLILQIGNYAVILQAGYYGNITGWIGNYGNITSWLLW